MLNVAQTGVGQDDRQPATIVVARIMAGMVAEPPIRVSDMDHVPPMQTWVRVPPAQAEHVSEGWSYADGVFAPPPATTPPVLPRYVRVAVARERLEAAGKWDALVGAMATDMPKLIKMLTLEQGLAADDPEVHAVLTAIGADPDAVLAP